MVKEAPTRKRTEEALRTFLTGALATIVVLAVTLVFEIVHERTDWPLGQSGWEIANIVVILVLMLAFGTFALARWGELVRQTTERKRAEEELRESEQRFRSTLDGMMEGCQIIGFDWRYLYVNDAVAKHGRRAKEELLGRTMVEVYPGIDDTEVFTHLKRCMDERVPHRMENQYTFPDGGTAWFELAIQPVPEGIFVLTVEITERKQAEEAIQESEHQFHTSVETLLDGFAIFSAIRDDAGGIVDFRYEYINEAGCRLNQRTREEQVGHTLLELLPAHKETGLFDEYMQVVETGQPLAKESLFYEDEYGEGQRLNRAFDVRVTKLGDGIIAAWQDVTERKRAEEELRESEARKSAILETALDCIITIDHEGRIIEFNPAAEKTFGYGRAEVLGRQMRELIVPPSLRESHRDGLANYLATGEGPIIDKRIETIAMRADGTEFPAEVAITHIASDGPPMFTGYIRDITERKRAEEELRESEHRFRAITEKTPVPMIITRIADGTILYANEPLGRLFGLLSKDTIGREVSAFYYDSADREVLIDQITRDGSVENHEMRLKKADGTPFSAIVFGRVTTFDGEQALVGGFYDVTERRRAEEELRESEQRLRTIFEATFEGIVIHDNGVILDANPAFERMFGYPLSEIIGKSVLDLTAEESRDLVMEKLTTRAQEPFEAIGMRKDGATLTAELIGKRHTYKGRGVTVTTLRDVTDRKRMEETLQAARDELEGKVERQLLRRNPYGLTFRELTVLHLVAVGDSAKQIGLKLGISPFTAQKHTSNILAKMDAASRTEAGVRAVREGLLD